MCHNSKLQKPIMFLQQVENLHSFDTHSPLLKMMTSWPLRKYEEQELTKIKYVWAGDRYMHHYTYV